MDNFYYTNQDVNFQQIDENRNENLFNKEKFNESNSEVSNSQKKLKVDASTMTDPLKIDLKMTSEYLEHISKVLGLPYTYDCDNSNSDSITQNSEDEKSRSEQYDIKPQQINGMLFYSCPECAYRFQDLKELEGHLEDHKQTSIYKCDICGANLKRKEHLDRHRQEHNKDRPYQCSMCCKAFKRNEHLARHMIIHSGSKNHVCTECGKAFYRKDHLKKHLQSHTNSSKNKNNITPNNINRSNNNNEEGLSTFAVMMRQAGPVSFSTLRT